MEDFRLTEDEKIEGQKKITDWLSDLPMQAQTVLQKLEEKISQFETFDLLANIAFYNHLQDSQQYTDSAERMFVISELIALIMLKKGYVSESAISMTESASIINDIQDLGRRYFTLKSIIQMHEGYPTDGSAIKEIAFTNMRHETTVRNPALPEHHMIFSGELYQPFDGEIKNRFGFSIKESVILRQAVVKLINERVNSAKDSADNRSIGLSMAVFKYRSTGLVPQDCLFCEETLTELNKLSRKEIKNACFNYCMNNFFYHLGAEYTFTAQDLAKNSGLELSVVESFLKEFCCTFLDVKPQDKLVGPNHILKSKPFIEHNGRFLLPSMPLLVWCVEPLIEDYIKSVQKLQNRFKETKHEFLLQKSKEFFLKILDSKTEFFTNLFYYDDSNNQQFETDGIFKFERTLFIVEAKGNRITQAAKEGRIDKTETHLKKIVKESYEQGLRTLNYIRSRSTAEFLTEKNQKVQFSRNDFDDVVLVSLTLEPIGNITPLIRVTNELGYFKNDIFPWIISIYDLIIFADHFDLPVLLPHYIKRRREFLARKIMHVFEEIDLMSYYLFNRLYIERIFKEAESENTNMVYLGNETDEINNYYMHKYRLNNPNPPKMQLKLPDIFLKILHALDKTQFEYRQEIMLHILDLSPYSIDRFNENIKKIKNLYAKDGKKHDCSILTKLWGRKIGFTFITAPNKIELDRELYLFCQYKMEKHEADIWIGVGDTEKSRSEFNIECAFIGKYQR